MKIKQIHLGFIQFIREQGIVGLAIGFILGGAMNRVVSSLVNDMINPSIALLFGSTAELASLAYGNVRYGQFLVNLIDFVILAAVVYFVFRGLKLDRLDIKKDPK
jgi:large conductance mechanosensitive channel